MFTDVPGATNQVYNIAFGQRSTVNELFFTIKDLLGASSNPIYREPRKGDVQDSLADISKAKAYLKFNPSADIRSGLKVTLEWFRKNFSRVAD